MRLSGLFCENSREEKVERVIGSDSYGVERAVRKIPGAVKLPRHVASGNHLHSEIVDQHEFV